jgi:hypothetical protein
MKLGRAGRFAERALHRESLHGFGRAVFLE